jgi:hypothetical protein
LKFDEEKVNYEFDAKSENDLVFDIELNKEYLLEEFGFRKIVISP